MRRTLLSAALSGGLFSLVCGSAVAQAPKGKTTPAKPPAAAPAEDKIQAINLLEGLRSGELGVTAEGRGDGKMTLAITNNTNRKLRVVLPPSLVAQGASGQFGGGGMGGGGMGGGGMGGGGMGGGGMGGQQGGGGGVMPASMGMMMLGMLIMQLVEPGSWDQQALFSGGMGMMGGGGMGGGMGGGGMGGGMRSLPATGPMSAKIEPGQTRNLPSTLVSLSPPIFGNKVALPAKGEALEIGDAADILDDSPLAHAALIRLASENAPATVAQLVMWNIRIGLDWPAIAKISRPWANANEVALARHFVSRLKAARGELKTDSGVLYVEIDGSQDAANTALAQELKNVLKGKAVIGLAIVEGKLPAKPEGPSVSFKVRLVGTGKASEAVVQVSTTDPTGREWVSAGKFTLPISRDDKDQIAPAKLMDAIAEGTLSRLVRVSLTKEKAKDKNGKDRYTIKVENASPLVLNCLALSGTSPEGEKLPTAMAGMSLAPHKNLSVPASPAVVERLKLSDGVRVLAADLSGL